MSSRYRKPSLEYYRKKAKKLVQHHRDRDSRSLSLIKYNHGRFGKLSLADIADRKFSLRDAQTVIARVNGYGGWAHLKSHVESINNGSSNRSLLFEMAADAVVHGRDRELRRLLDRHPELVHQRSRRNHRATLLHYVAANGVEDDRQMTPPNAVEIARLLLERGATPDALAESYGGGHSQTTLSLLVSSGHPNAAGLQSELVKVLCEFGAQPDGLDQDGLPLATALVFFFGKTAQMLAQCGARTDHLLAAAAVGTPQDVDRCFTAGGRLKKGNFVYLGFELRPPANRQEMLGQAFVYAAMCGNLRTMKRLHSSYRCPIDAPADRGIRALHLAAFKGHEPIVNWLLKNGADARIRDNQWHATPVAWAFEAKQLKIRSKMIRSIDLDIHLAVSFFCTGKVKQLLSANPELAQTRSDRGLLPIHCLHDDTEDGQSIIEWLLAAGADVNGFDPDGRTAIDRLLVHGRKDLVAVLREHGGRSNRELNPGTNVPLK